MSQRIVHSVDGKRVSQSRFQEICSAKENKFTILGDRALGNHFFSSFDQYDSFLRNHAATASAYLSSLAAGENRQTTLKKLGRRRAMSFSRTKSKLFTEINETLARFTKEAGAETIEEETSLLRSVVSPKMGSVYFYAEPHFGVRFANYEGLTHSSVENLEAWNDKLNSVLMRAYESELGIEQTGDYQFRLYEIRNPTPSIRLTLYEDECYSTKAGQLLLYCHSGYERSLRDLHRYGWGDCVSSWWFW